jgi:hypothetical protein
LKEAVDVVEGGITSSKKASKRYNILLTSLFDHLYGKTKFRKLEPIGVLIEEKN